MLKYITLLSWSFKEYKYIQINCNTRSQYLEIFSVGYIPEWFSLAQWTEAKNNIEDNVRLFSNPVY